MHLSEPRPYRWTADEYQRLCETEWFREKRVQLVGEEIVDATAAHLYLWTRDDYYRLCEQEWFLEKRVQLIGGAIVEMSAQKNEHGISIDQTRDVLVAIFGPGFWVRAQMSLDLSPLSVPDPDLTVVPGTRRSYAGQPIPTAALLVVEVSETTLSYDRNRKASLYAAAGITDYWIVNLVDRQVEVYRNAVPDPSQAFGLRYDSETDLLPGDIVSPLALPGATIAVADLFS